MVFGIGLLAFQAPRLGAQAIPGTSVSSAEVHNQQLAAEPAPGALDVTLPEGGRVLTFTRSLQVDGGAPLGLTLAVERSAGRGLWFAIGVVVATAGLGALAMRRRTA